MAWLADTSLDLDNLLIRLQDKVTEKWYEFGDVDSDNHCNNNMDICIM